MNNEIKYEKRIVLYLDILGFKNAVDKSIEDQEVLQTIYKSLNNIYSDKIKNYQGPLKGLDYGTHISVFSDNIVMSEPYNRNGSLYNFIYSVYWLVNEILWDGFVVRGAITIGDLFHDDKVIFGPALNKAYKMESEMAIFPRVIISKDDVAEGLKMALHDDIEETKYFNIVLEVDEDGFFYLNNITKHHEFDDNETYVNLLFKLRRIIVEGLKNTNLKVRAKYEWLKAKYNQLYDTDIDSRAPGKITE